MSKLLITITILSALALGTGLFAQYEHSKPASEMNKSEIPTPVYDSWVHWKQRNGKSYGTDSEDTYRLGVFYGWYKFIMQKDQVKGQTYTLEQNEFADVTSAEFKKMYLGTNVNAQKVNETQIERPIMTASQIDWRSKGAVTDVKNQGQCGSCWAFSTTGGLEGQNAIKSGKLLSFSEQQLVDCNHSWNPFNPGNNGCNGGLMARAFRYTNTAGIEEEATYPYTAKTGTCTYDKTKTVFKNTSYKSVPSSDNDQLTLAISQQPISVAIDGEGIQMYKSGIFNDWSCYNQLNHGVLAAGFGVESGNMFYLVKNSWGKAWGEDGYIRFARKSGSGVGMCGITEQAAYPTL